MLQQFYIGTIVKAQRPVDLFRNSIATAPLVASIINGKYANHGAKASAMIYSIVETAKANGLNTYQYLELLLTELPKHTKDKSLAFLDELLP